MEIRVIDGRDLTSRQVADWRALQLSNPDLRNPYFCPEYLQAVAHAQDGVEVAVIEADGRAAAFFPFQRARGGLGKPAGGFISDYQGLICAPGFACDPMRLLKACGLTAWDFDHLPASQACFRPFHRRAASSPLIDLSEGVEAYLSTCRAARSEQIKLRRLERELGPVRFVAHTADAGLFDLVLGWKAAQHAASGFSDVLSLPWLRGSLIGIRDTQTPTFAGMCSVLFAGDTPVAGHFGMRSATIWHYWFPAYDPQYARFSPGLVLLLKMIEAAGELGLDGIDLGKGASLYKDRFANTEIPLAEGSVERSSLRAAGRAARRWLGRALS